MTMSIRWHLLLVAALLSCHGYTVRHRGVVRAPSGAAPAPGLSVTVTDVATGRELTRSRTDGAGQFEFSAPPGRYAFAVTDASGYAFIDKPLTSTERVAIMLSSSCHPTRGRVTGARATAASVVISRISDSVGDRFIAPMDRDGRFAVCLPAGLYSARTENGLLSLATPVNIPRDSSIALTAYPAQEVQRPARGARLEHFQLAPFARAISQYQVLGLGEANHGTGDFYTYRGQLSLELARLGNLRTIVVEADAIEMMAIDDYVTGNDVDLERSVSALRFWISDVQEFLTVLRRIRSYNSAAGLHDQIHVLGIDAQRMEPPVRFLAARRSALDISEQEARLLARLSSKHGDAFTSMSPDEQLSLGALLDRLSASGEPVDLSSDRARAGLAARSIRHQLDYLSAEGSLVLRDRAMADLAAYIVQLTGPNQVAIWAHDGHIARQPDIAIKSLGQYLAEKFGRAYYPIAFLSYRGASRAWDAGGKVGVIPHELAIAPSYNVESVIMNATGFPDAAWIKLDDSSGWLARWLTVPRYVREFGSVYIPEETQTLRPFPAAFGAVVVVRNATSSTPTPTGVRMISK